MKSQQAILEDILTVSIKKALGRLSGDQLKEFEEQIGMLRADFRQTSEKNQIVGCYSILIRVQKSDEV